LFFTQLSHSILGACLLTQACWRRCKSHLSVTNKQHLKILSTVSYDILRNRLLTRDFLNASDPSVIQKGTPVFVLHRSSPKALPAANSRINKPGYAFLAPILSFQYFQD